MNIWPSAKFKPKKQSVNCIKFKYICLNLPNSIRRHLYLVPVISWFSYNLQKSHRFRNKWNISTFFLFLIHWHFTPVLTLSILWTVCCVKIRTIVDSPALAGNQINRRKTLNSKSGSQGENASSYGKMTIYKY